LKIYFCAADKFSAPPTQKRGSGGTATQVCAAQKGACTYRQNVHMWIIIEIATRLLLLPDGVKLADRIG